MHNNATLSLVVLYNIVNCAFHICFENKLRLHFGARALVPARPVDCQSEISQQSEAQVTPVWTLCFSVALMCRDQQENLSQMASRAQFNAV